MADECRAAPADVTIVCLGPLTNVARALARDPDFVNHVGRLVIMGGSVRCVGNATPCAEFNIHADPASARAVFRSPLAKTLVPLDVTDQVVWTFDFLDKLPPETTRAGKLLRLALPYLFRSHRQHLGLESIRLPDAVAMLAVLHPELFRTEDLYGDVEAAGELTTGATIFDRRPNCPHRPNIEVALELDPAAIADAILRGLTEAGRQSAG
jgi:purine nucleosidase